MRDTRIQKAMADQGLCSRRAAEQIILEGRVKLNGRPVQLGDKMDIRADILSVDGQRVFFDKKKEFYRKGGITVTGGEPLMQIDFVTELFEACKKKNIHTCLDSSGIMFNEAKVLKYIFIKHK